MTIHDKLARLTQLSQKATVSKAAGLSPATLYNLIHRRQSVTTRVAVSLARVLSVDVGWLVDDRREWPPVRVDEPEACSAA